MCATQRPVVSKNDIILSFSASISFTQNATNPLPFLKLVTNNALKWGKEGWGGHIGVSIHVNLMDSHSCLIGEQPDHSQSETYAG